MNPANKITKRHLEIMTAWAEAEVEKISKTPGMRLPEFAEEDVAAAKAAIASEDESSYEEIYENLELFVGPRDTGWIVDLEKKGEAVDIMSVKF